MGPLTIFSGLKVLRNLKELFLNFIQIYESEWYKKWTSAHAVIVGCFPFLQRRSHSSICGECFMQRPLNSEPPSRGTLWRELPHPRAHSLPRDAHVQWLIDMEDKAWVPHTNSWQFQRVIQASDLSIWLAETFVEPLTQLTFPFTYSYFFPFPSVVPGAPLINLLCDNLYLKSASWELNLQDIQLWGRKTSQPQRKKEKRRNKWALKLVINQNEVKQVKSDPSLELFPHVIKSDISSKRNSI